MMQIWQLLSLVIPYRQKKIRHILDISISVKNKGLLGLASLLSNLVSLGTMRQCMKGQGKICFGL